MHPFIKAAYFIFITWGIVLLLIFSFSQKDSITHSLNFSQIYSFNFQDSNLASIVKKDLEGKPGEYAVYIEAMNDPLQKYTLDSQKKFQSASLYKLFLLAAAFQAIEKGELSEDTEITASTSQLQEVLGFKDFGYEDSSSQITYTVPELLERIATISDNYASIMLAEKLTWDKVQSQADLLGASDTTIKAPITTSAADIGLFFNKLYKKEIVSENASDKIIELLSKSKIKDRIPAKLPEGLKIAHKTAELPLLRHDAGIVFLEGKPYVIVLMSQNLKFEDEGIETLAAISKDVYDYFSKK